MICRPALALALATALTGFGCTALRPSAETIEYRPGSESVVVEARCDATYELETVDDKRRGFAPVDVRAGQSVGFRRDADGRMVAFAAWQTYPLPEGRCVWRHTPKPVTRWDRFAVGARDGCGMIATAVYLPFFVTWAVLTGGEVP